MRKLFILILIPISFFSQEIEITKPDFRDVELANKHNDIINIYAWYDSLGKNTLIMTADRNCGEMRDEYCDLRFYHYTGKNKLLWDIKDYAEDKYEYGISLNEIDFSDVDGDGIVEISILYNLGGDDIYSVKLILHENGKKYAIRGKTGFDYRDRCVYDYDMFGRNSFEYAKNSFRNHALGLFSDAYNCYSD